MKNRRGVEAWLADIVRSGEKLSRHIDGFTLELFLADEKTQDAVAKCAEEIGAAAGEILKLEQDFDELYPNLQLAGAYASRNRLSHGNHSIDYGILWKTASKAIPVTVEAARVVLTQNRSDRDGPEGSVGGGP